MSETLAFKITNLDKDRTNEIIETVSQKTGLNKGDAFVKIIDEYNKQILLKGKVSDKDTIPPNVSDVLNSIDCTYLIFDEEQFYCLEDYHKKKKRYSIGIEPERVKTNCNLCLRGKADIINKKIEKERRKESFKRFEKLAKQVMKITEKGFITNAFMCQYDIVDGNVAFSRDGETLQCGLRDNDIVNINDVCMEALNPKTGKPPCQNLITLEHITKITKDDIKEMDIVLPTIEYKTPSTQPIQQNNNNNQKRKTVEADYQIKNDEPIDNPCPECGNELIETFNSKKCSVCAYEESFDIEDELSRDEIKKILDEKDIEYNKRARTSTLIDLLKEHKEDN